MNRSIWALFYLATTLFGIAEGFLLVLALYINDSGGSEALTGTILFFQSFGALFVIPFGGVILGYVRVTTLILAGAGLFALSAGLFWASAVDNTATLILAGLLSGAGWAIAYTATPITVSKLSPSDNTVIHFSLLAASNMAGMGISPLIAYALHAQGALRLMFPIAMIAVLVSGGLFLVLTRLTPLPVPDRNRGRESSSDTLRSFASLVRSARCFPLAMVLIGACIFSTMSNFQSTFAQAEGLSFPIYYLSYTLSVIAARIVFSAPLSRFNLHSTVNIMLAIMCAGLLLFPFLGGSNIVYALSAILLGVGYGLAYPTLKGCMVEGIEGKKRDRALVLFSLSYFVGLYMFPYVSGRIITEFGYPSLLWVLTGLGLGELALGLTLQRCNAATS
ncbi:MAG: MFS transporter [Hyphomicrobiales bacterium]